MIMEEDKQFGGMLLKEENLNEKRKNNEKFNRH